MSLKLVLADIDGTLLNDEKQLLPSTVETIQRLVESGILFATATARTISYTVSGISPLMQLCCANAYVNGAYVETSDGQVLIDDPIDDKDASVLINQLDEIKASFCRVAKDHLIVHILHPPAEPGFRLHHGSYSQRFNSESFHREHKDYLIQAAAPDLSPVVELAARQLPDLEISPIIQRPPGLEVAFFQKKGIDKAAALRKIARHYNVPLSETAAIGDSMLNDMPMIEAAGYGIAMRNASEALLKKAARVTPEDNNADGAGRCFKDLFGL
jgi:Cof subfamily protein (haloacid dehalogenase superfamily)